MMTDLVCVICVVCLWRQSPLYVLNWPPRNIATSHPYLVTLVTGARKGRLHVLYHHSSSFTVMRLLPHGILLTSQFVPFLLYLLLSAILKLTLCLLTILPPRYTHPRASDSPCEVWRVTNCDLYCICIVVIPKIVLRLSRDRL